MNTVSLLTTSLCLSCAVLLDLFQKLLFCKDLFLETCIDGIMELEHPIHKRLPAVEAERVLSDEFLVIPST